jgi:hypothetical protein
MYPLALAGGKAVEFAASFQRVTLRPHRISVFVTDPGKRARSGLRQILFCAKG